MNELVQSIRTNAFVFVCRCVLFRIDLAIVADAAYLYTRYSLLIFFTALILTKFILGVEYAISLQPSIITFIAFLLIETDFDWKKLYVELYLRAKKS